MWVRIMGTGMVCKKAVGIATGMKLWVRVGVRVRDHDYGNAGAYPGGLWGPSPPGVTKGAPKKKEKVKGKKREKRKKKEKKGKKEGGGQLREKMER